MNALCRSIFFYLDFLRKHIEASCNVKSRMIFLRNRIRIGTNKNKAQPEITSAHFSLPNGLRQTCKKPSKRAEEIRSAKERPNIKLLLFNMREGFRGVTECSLSVSGAKPAVWQAQCSAVWICIIHFWLICERSISGIGARPTV